jgi:hypothetical protein
LEGRSRHETFVTVVAGGRRTGIQRSPPSSALAVPQWERLWPWNRRRAVGPTAPLRVLLPWGELSTPVSRPGPSPREDPGASPSFPTSRPATTATSTRRSEPDRPSISRQERASYGRRRIHQLACWVHFAPRAIRAKPLSPSVARVAAYCVAAPLCHKRARQQCSNWTL